MLEVENLSPFPHLTFSALDVEDRLWDTVVARGTYRLTSVTSGTTTHALVEAGTQMHPLVSDAYVGRPGFSSVRAESDLAPFKPRCDVVLTASASSPSGGPAQSVEVAVRVVRRPIDYAASEQAATGVLLEHRLVVHGERYFLRRGVGDRAAAAVVGAVSLGKVQASEWHLGEAEPFVECAITDDFAYGGRLEVRAGDTAVIDRLDEDRKERISSAEPAADDAPVLVEEYEDNPYGTGFMQPWFASAALVKRWPAPRIEVKGHPVTAEHFDAMARGGDAQASLSTDGFGVVAKHWPRRRKLAGTCDEVWERERCPRLPKDFDMAFWNGASPSMQCARLFGGETVELENLLPPVPATADGGRSGSTVASFRLPRVGLMMRFEGAQGAIYEPVFIDTLDIDLHEMEVSLVWRFRVLRVEGSLPARLIALGPILDEHPHLIPGVVAAAARGRSPHEEEMV